MFDVQYLEFSRAGAVESNILGTCSDSSSFHIAVNCRLLVPVTSMSTSIVDKS